MSISDSSIKKPVFAWMLMLGLMIFGGISFYRLGVSQLPDVDFPVVSVSIAMEGAAPETVETTIVDPIEDVLMSVEGIKSISSVAKQSKAQITLEFDLNKNIDVAVQEVQTKMAQAQNFLPRESDPPVITKTNPDDQPILWLALTTANSDMRFLMTFARDYLKDQFSTVAGVGDITLGGYVDPNLRVWVKPEELRKYNISVNDIINSIQNEHTELPGGQIATAEKNYNVRTLGEAKTAEEFGNIIIQSRAGLQNQDPFNLLKIKNVARVEEGLAEITRLSRFNGVQAIGLGIRKQKGENAVEVAKKVKEKIKKIQPTLPKDLQLHLNFDTTRFIEEAIHELNFTLILSAFLTAIACWFFLGSWSATFNVILAIPTSILGAFIPLYFLGFTLNTFTLLGLSLAIGIVVDDAIMVLENIFRHNEAGRPRIEAAIIGAREITFAAMAATVSIMAIFLPVAFMKGVIGKFFFQFGVTISFAVFLSLIEALTITPMRCAQFVQHGKRTTWIGRAFEWSMTKMELFYSFSLKYVLRFNWMAVLIASVFLYFSFTLVKNLKKEFSPPQDQSVFLVRLQTPPGSSLAFTDKKVKEAEAFLSKREEVLQYYAAVGGFGGGPGDSNSGMMFVTMKPKKDRPIDPETGKKITQQSFMNIIRINFSKIKDLRPVIQDLSMRGFSSSRGFPIEFNLRGPDWEKLYQYSLKIREEMEKSGLMTDIDTDYILGAPELQITPQRQAAAFHGVSIQAIGKTVNALIGGVRVGQYEKNGHRYDVRVQIEKSYENLEEVRKLLVGNARANLIPLSQLTREEIKPSLQQISRVDRQRSISVFANLKGGASQQDALSLVQQVSKNILPDGYGLFLSGSAETFKESFQSLIFALILGLLVAYMVLASQFNSFMDPFSVLVALPFSISGAFMALHYSHQSMNIYSMIGIILLMGIVKKNSILLIDYTNTLIDQGESIPKQALQKACPVRLRPILMTSFATIFGAIPPALSIGPGAETRIPMALTVIGGVTVSTFLTLYIVPAFYLIFARFQKRSEIANKIKKAFENVG